MAVAVNSSKPVVAPKKKRKSASNSGDKEKSEK